MSYSKHEWVNGETITAAKMNNIEEGIAEAAQSGGGGSAYDLVIKLNNNAAYSATAATVISGTFAECETKAFAQEPLHVLVYGVNDDPNYPYTNTFGIINAYFDNYMYDENDHEVNIRCSCYDSISHKIKCTAVHLYRTGVVELEQLGGATLS